MPLRLIALMLLYLLFAGQVDGEAGGDAEGLAGGAKIDLGINREIFRQADALLGGNGLHRADKAGGIAGSKQLFRVGAIAFAGRGVGDLQMAVIAL